MLTPETLLTPLLDKIKNRRTTTMLSVIGRTFEANQTISVDLQSILQVLETKIKEWIKDDAISIDPVYAAFFSKTLAAVANLYVMKGDIAAGKSFYKDCRTELRNKSKALKTLKKKHELVDVVFNEMITYEEEILDKNLVDWNWVDRDQ